VLLVASAWLYVFPYHPALNNPNLKKNKTAPASSSTAKSGASTAKTTTASKSGSSSARSTTSSSTSSSRTTTSGTSTATTAKKPAPPVATKEDPAADVSLFEPAAPQRSRRARRATPSVITDPTPRDIFAVSTDDETAAKDLVAAFNPDDPLARARQRRRNAGYSQRSA